MPLIHTTTLFSNWFVGLKDVKGRFRIQARIDRAEMGNLGDCEPIGEGVFDAKRGRDHRVAGWW